MEGFGDSADAPLRSRRCRAAEIENTIIVDAFCSVFFFQFVFFPDARFLVQSVLQLLLVIPDIITITITTASKIMIPTPFCLILLLPLLYSGKAAAATSAIVATTATSRTTTTSPKVVNLVASRDRTCRV